MQVRLLGWPRARTVLYWGKWCNGNLPRVSDGPGTATCQWLNCVLEVQVRFVFSCVKTAGVRVKLSLCLPTSTRLYLHSATSGDWTATTEGNPFQYSHLFHGVHYDANLESSSQSLFTSVQLYNTTDRTQTGVPTIPTLHTMPPIAPVDTFTAVSVTGTGTSGFSGLFIQASGVNVYWQLNAQTKSKHHVGDCEMCGVDVCSLIVKVSDDYMNSLATLDNFTCSMDPGKLGNASYVFDFGHNMAGYVGLDTSSVPAGTTIYLCHAELISSSGAVDNTYCGYPCHCGGDGGNCANQVRTRRINFWFL